MVQTALKELLGTKRPEELHVDLSRLFLGGLVADEWRFDNVNLAWTEFYNAELKNCTFHGSNLYQTTFHNATLESLDLSKATGFNGKAFSGAEITGEMKLPEQQTASKVQARTSVELLKVAASHRASLEATSAREYAAKVTTDAEAESRTSSMRELAATFATEAIRTGSLPSQIKTATGTVDGWRIAQYQGQHDWGQAWSFTVGTDGILYDVEGRKSNMEVGVDDFLTELGKLLGKMQHDKAKSRG